MAARRIGILGGTFDPIHTGHTDIGTAAEAALELTRIIVIPSSLPPHRPQPIVSSFHRFAMAALTVVGRQRWQISDLELREPSPSYTSATLARFHERGYRPDELYFIIGADAFSDIAAWKDYPAILDAAHFAVVSRPHWRADDLPPRLPSLASRMVTDRAALNGRGGQTMIILIDALTADVSSTAIRRLRTEGKPITGMVGASVQQYIEQHGLYTSMAPGRRANETRPSPAAGRLHDES